MNFRPMIKSEKNKASRIKQRKNILVTIDSVKIFKTINKIH